MTYYGGVEGGATNTVATIINEKGEILGYGKSAGCNTWQVGITGAVHEIVKAVEDAKSEAGLKSDITLTGLGICIGGSQQAMIDVFHKEYPALANEIIVKDDTAGSMATAFDQGGIVLIAGTGSNCVYNGPDGSSKRCGGWGNFMGDEGSAWWISHRAIKYLFDDDDNLKKAPFSVEPLRAMMHGYFKVESNTEMLNHFYTGFSKSFFAGFCKEISHGAIQKKDQLCRHVFKEAAQVLADHIAGVMPYISKEYHLLNKGTGILCIGSVWNSWELLEDGFFSRLREKINGETKSVKLLKPVITSAVGAAILVAKHCGSIVSMDLSKHTKVFHQETSDMDAVDLKHKVLKYEQFLNETLRGDLSNLNNQREKVFEETADYLHLQTTLEKLKEAGFTDGSKPVKTQVDLGCQFFAQAVISDASMVFVHVGYGFFVEFTVDEALPFIEEKISRLNIKAEKLGKAMAQVRAQIRMVLEGLRELQGL